MRTLLLGATGLIGAPLCDALQQQGHELWAVSRSPQPEPRPGVRAIAVDREDPAALAAALEGQRFDLTVDLLAYRGAHVEQLFAIEGFEPGRAVMMSTGQVYLVTEREPPFREEDFDGRVIDEPERDTRAWHNWVYGVEKREAERALQRVARERGFEAMAMRVPVVQGERDGARTQRLWAWIERVMDGGPVLLPEGGEQRLRFAYSGDIADAVLALSARGSWEGVGAINVAQPGECTLRGLVERVAESVGRAPEWVPVSAEALDQAGIARDFVPYWGRYFSRPEPTLAIERFGLALHDVDHWIDRVVRAHLEGPHRARSSHPGYAHRAAERALAQRLTARP